MSTRFVQFTACAFAAVLVAAWVDTSAQVLVSPEQLRERGVLLYVPFEDSAAAVVAAGQKEPWVARDLLYTVGVHGRAVQMLHMPSRYAVMPSGESQKYKNGQSMLVYEALGNLYKRRGTLAFWVLSPWDARNKDLLTGSSLTGPYVIGIASRDVYAGFFTMVRRKSFFECRFGGRRISGELKYFRTFAPKLIPRWQANHWHHVAVTWDDRRGFAIYLNGELIDRYTGDIAWDLYEPDTIALGSRPLSSRDLWPTNHNYVFDELLVFSRSLAAEEVVLVKDGKYTELRPTTAKDWSFDPGARRMQLNLGERRGRPAFRATAPSGVDITIRQQAVDEVDMDYHRRFLLVDGNPVSYVRFSDGGLTFDIPARFCFGRLARVNHLVTILEEPNGSYWFEDSPDNPGAPLLAGRAHLTVPDREREGLGIFFKGNSIGREVAFFDIRAGVESTGRGKRFPIVGTVSSGDLADPADVLLGAPHPGDQPALLAASGRAGPAERVFRRGAMHHCFIVLGAAEHDRFVDTVHVVLPVKPVKARFDALVRIHDPCISGRIALDLDLTMEWPAPGTELPLALSLSPPGLIIPAGERVVLDLLLDTDWEMRFGGDAAAYVEVAEGDARRIGHEFARAQLRRIWPGFLRRLNQNRFLQRGERKEANPIWRGLTLAERYDPGNEQVKAWWGWSRMRPWPEFDYGYLDEQSGPRWAVYTREAVRSMQAVIHWWLDHRAHPNGYLVGGGNQWNDITKFYNKYLCLGALAGDKRVVDAIERYLDAHWNSGRMVHGFTRYFTDMTHAAEEASYIQPCFNILRPGVPRHVYRDLLNASNYPKWLGKNDYGHTHFRSNFINADRMLTEGMHGRDTVGCESATVPGTFLWWYNGHPPTAELLTAYADSWLEDTKRGAKGKAAGVVPWSVQFEGDELFAGSGSRFLIYDKFLALFELTGDRKYLEPLETLLRGKGDVGGSTWKSQCARNCVMYRTLSGVDTFDGVLRELAAERFAGFAEDAFFQRGIESTEAQALCRWGIDHAEVDLIEMLRFVIRNNRRSFHPYTLTDPPTDRVYPWGRSVLSVVMLGGRVFDGRAANPLPAAAFAWEGIDTDVVSMVFARAPGSLKMLVHNFRDQPLEAGLRALQLPEGTYRLSVAEDADSDREPDSEPQVREVEMRRFTATPLMLSAKQTLYVDLALLKKRPKQLRPDLAVTLAAPAGAGGGILARVHNLGCVSAANIAVRLLDVSGKSVGEAIVSELAGLTEYEPQFRDVKIAVPAGAKIAECRLVVDPDDTIFELNEANNAFRVAAGVPPPVESAPE